MKADLSDLVAKFSKDELKTLILKYADIYSDLRNEILSSKFTRDPSFDELRIKEWIRRITEAIKEDERDADIDDYYPTATVCWEETFKVTRKAVEDLCLRNLGQEALDLLDFAETELEEAESGFCLFDEWDNEIEVEFIQNPSVEFDKHRLTIVECFPELRQKVFDYFEELASEGCLNDGWLTSFATKADKSKQLETILKYLKNNSHSRNDYRNESYAKQAIYLLNELDRTKVQAFLKEYKTIPSLREEMEKYYIKKGDNHQAIVLIEEDKKSGRLSIHKRKVLVDLYMKTGQKQSATKELSEIILSSSHPTENDLSIYEYLAGKKEWEKLALHLINNKNCDDKVRMKLCRELGRLDLLTEIIKSASPSRIRDQFVLPNYFDRYIKPNDSFITSKDAGFIPGLMIALIDKGLSHTRSTTFYRTSVNVLKELCKEKQREHLIHNSVKDLMKKYHSRRSLLEELEEAGF